MNRIRINYRDFQNRAQLTRITELMECLRPIFPEWAESIDVERFDRIDDSDQSTMSVNLNRDYLNFRIEVYNCFWQVPEEMQRRKVIHEIVHALHADVIMFNRDRMIDYIKAQNADLGAYIAQEHTARVERFTQSMAFAIERMITATEAKAQEANFGASGFGHPSTSWPPETPCEDCGKAIGLNASHPSISRPLCRVHRELELNVPSPKTCHICLKPIAQRVDCVEGPPGAWSHPECFTT